MWELDMLPIFSPISTDNQLMTSSSKSALQHPDNLHGHQEAMREDAHLLLQALTFFDAGLALDG